VAGVQPAGQRRDQGPACLRACGDAFGEADRTAGAEGHGEPREQSAAPTLRRPTPPAAAPPGCGHVADRLAQDGASVHPRERDDTVDDKKNPDSMVRTSPEDPGTVTEFKALESASSNGVRQNILAAAKQVDQYGGGDAILDGREVKLTDEDARRGYSRAVGQARQVNLPMPDRVMIIMGDGSIKVFPEG
jgi:hypothetical protein